MQNYKNHIFRPAFRCQPAFKDNTQILVDPFFSLCVLFLSFTLSLLFSICDGKRKENTNKNDLDQQRHCKAPLHWSNYTALFLFAMPELDSSFKTTKDLNKEIYSNLRRKIIQSVKVFCSLSIFKISGLCFKNLN